MIVNDVGLSGSSKWDFFNNSKSLCLNDVGEDDLIANVRYTINGVYLENGELSFDVDCHAYFFVDEYSEPNNRPERMSVAEVVELAERYDDFDYDLCMVLDHYIELLNRYNHENAYIENP